MQKNSFNYDELIACGKGDLFGEGNAKLPLPPMLMFDRITEIKEDTGQYKKGFINSKYLSKIVFDDPEKLKELNSIIHPLVEKDFKKFKIISRKSIIFFESAILFESKINLKFDYTILITAPIKIRIDRIIKRDYITVSQIMSRVEKQWSDEKKALFADRLIENIDWKTTVVLLENLLIDLKNKFNIAD